VLEINGQRRQIQVEPRTTLLSALRHRCEPALTGSKEVCGRGNCGACTVLLDGQPAYACLILAVEAEGRAVTTVEGLGSPEALSEVQAAFCDKDALMCGFCTPGFVVAATALLARSPAATRPEIVSGLCGNLCRCGTYPHVFDAVEVARDRLAARAPQGGAR
jgi:aerobic-type carbon monoxide dehydrogenase small subunit (CoxS/CutS family)